MKNSILVSMVFIILTSCNKSTSPNTPSSSIFPNNVGNHWHYKYTDNSQNISYIDVDIVGTRVLPNGQTAAVWVYKILSYTDTVIVTSNTDSTIIYENYCTTCPAQTLYAKMKYYFPMQTGNIWFSNVLWGDTTKIINNNSVTVPAGTFNNTFQISKKVGYVVNTKTNNQIWFTQNVGITKLNQNEYNLGPVAGNGIWELESYTVK